MSEEMTLFTKARLVTLINERFNQEDAAFIVRAVNAHEELLDTLKAILDYSQKHDTGSDSPIEWLVKEAVAKAEGR